MVTSPSPGLADLYGLTVDADGVPTALADLGAGPLTVVNFFALRTTAAYDDGRADGGSGLDAMMRYAEVSRERLEAVGGRFLAQAIAPRPLWGEAAGWDLVVVAAYPDRAALLALLADPRYQEAYVHRRAAVAREQVTVAPTIA